MQYTVSSRGRPIGTTDLGFKHFGGRGRLGWFHPNAEGEQVMPVIASVLPALRAYMDRDTVGEDGRPIVQPQMMGSSEFADIAEALHHVEALELTLHREDGTLVPTECVGIQDTHQLLALAREELDKPDWMREGDGFELDLEDDGGEDDGDELALIRELVPALDGDEEIDIEEVQVFFTEDRSDDAEGWTPDGDEIENDRFPRYQVHVMLVDASSVP